MFHWYGFFIGLGLVLGLELIERATARARLEKHDIRQVQIALWCALFLGFLGARAWHVFTDFSLYQSNILATLYIWNGGLSIIGGIVFGAVGLWSALRLQRAQLQFAQVADLVVFGLPIGQAVGRFGNFINQELYGLPSDLPWSIPIDLEHRAIGYEQFERFHPLFAYESLALFLFGIWVWWWGGRRPAAAGRLALSYIVFYCTLRFFLEFLRIEKAPSGILALSINQVVVLFAALFCAAVVQQRKMYRPS